MYPRDAITLVTSTTTAGNFTILPATTTPYTVLYLSIFDTSGNFQQVTVGGVPLIQKNGSVQLVLLGTTYWDTQDVDTSLQYVYTNKSLVFSKQGTATSTATVVYVPRDRTSVVDPVLASSTVSFGSTTIATMDASTTQMYQNYLTTTTTLEYAGAFVVTALIVVAIFRKLFY